MSRAISSRKILVSAADSPPPPDKECTLNCVRGGSDFVLLSGGKIYKIANQKDPALKTFAGDEVKVTGELKGEVITASKIEKAQ